MLTRNGNNIDAHIKSLIKIVYKRCMSYLIKAVHFHVKWVVIVDKLLTTTSETG